MIESLQNIQPIQCDRRTTTVLVIEAGRTERHYWRDLWRHRELLYFLAWRDVLVRYKQTAIGLAWTLIRPLVTMIVFTLVFGALAKLPSGNAPYPLLVFAALLPWLFFANAFSEAANSLISNADIISKVYFPRMIVPASVVLVNFADFLVSGALMALLMGWYGFLPDWRILSLPLFVSLAFLLALGAGLWVAALNVKYRDFRYIIPFVVQFGLFISPVGFSSSVVPGEWRLLYSLNPMVGVIDGFRWAVLRDDAALYWPGFSLAVALSIGLFVGGFLYFRKMERSMADVI